MNSRNKIMLGLGVLVLVAATPGCGIINQLRAKDTLNEGVRQFNTGKYDLAEQKFKRALELSPEMGNAQLFYARALNAQFEQNLTEDLGLKTVAAYDDIIKTAGNDHESVDRALAFQSGVYDKLIAASPDKAEEYRQKRREGLLKRAELPGATPKTKADVYYTLGESYWRESYNLNSAYVTKKQPIPPPVLEKMKPLVQKAHEYLQKAVSVEPEYANAYFYEKLVFLEELKFETNPARQKELAAKVTEMQNRYTKLQEESQKQAGEQPAAQ